ncbi:plasma membrane fusion protein prm1 [Podila clonocystis]|nr:plasma membrane fusion protein prm1 [Podila clonocystis]
MRNNFSKDLELSEATITTATTTTAAQIDQLTHHPLIFHFVDVASWCLFPTNATNRTLFLWFMTYITHPPALTCLLLGALGLILVYTQITLLNYARLHYRPVLLLQPLTALSHTVLVDIRRAMAHSSAQFARDTNAEIARLESSINTQVFGAIVRSAGEMASALENVQTSLVGGVQEAFGGLFGALILAVLGCLLLNKLDRVHKPAAAGARGAGGVAGEGGEDGAASDGETRVYRTATTRTRTRADRNGGGADLGAV